MSDASTEIAALRAEVERLTHEASANAVGWNLSREHTADQRAWREKAEQERDTAHREIARLLARLGETSGVVTTTEAPCTTCGAIPVDGVCPTCDAGAGAHAPAGPVSPPYTLPANLPLSDRRHPGNAAWLAAQEQRR